MIVNFLLKCFQLPRPTFKRRRYSIRLCFFYICYLRTPKFTNRFEQIFFVWHSMLHEWSYKNILRSDKEFNRYWRKLVFCTTLKFICVKSTCYINKTMKITVTFHQETTMVCFNLTSIYIVIKFQCLSYNEFIYLFRGKSIHDAILNLKWILQ